MRYVQNMEISEFRRREYVDQMYTTISSKDEEDEEDEHIHKKNLRMILRSKLGRAVPIFITPNMEKSIKVMIHHRYEANVSGENKFLFGLPSNPGKIELIDGGNILRYLSELCGAENPETLSCTKIRKLKA